MKTILEQVERAVDEIQELLSESLHHLIELTDELTIWVDEVENGNGKWSHLIKPTCKDAVSTITQIGSEMSVTADLVHAHLEIIESFITADDE